MHRGHKGLDNKTHALDQIMSLSYHPLCGCQVCARTFIVQSTSGLSLVMLVMQGLWSFAASHWKEQIITVYLLLCYYYIIAIFEQK